MFTLHRFREGAAMRIAAAVLALSLSALPAVADMINFSVPMSGLMTQSGMRGPALPYYVTDSMGMRIPNASIHYAYSPQCGTNPMPMDVVTDAMGMATTPDFISTGGYGMCTVFISIMSPMSSPMTTTSYMLDVYRMSDIMLSLTPAQLIDAVPGNPYNFSVNAMVHGMPLVNALSTFSVNAMGMANVSSMMPMAALTDSMGTVNVSALANMDAGVYQIDANVAGATATFTVHQDMAMMPPPSPQVQAQASAASPAGNGPITVSVTGAPCTFGMMNMMGMSDMSVPPPPPAGIAFPQGLVNLRLDNCGMGQSANIAIDYPQELPPTAQFWRYGMTMDNLAPHWYMVPALIQSHRLLVNITDGAMGDDDMMMNGSMGVFGGVGFAGGLLQDLWWSGNAENGWGMSITQHGDTLFSVIYAYDSAGRPAWYAMPGGTWNASHTAYTGALYQPHGSPYFSYDASRLSVGASLGTATLTFMDSSNATLEYDIGGASGRKSIVRQIYGAPDMMNRGSHADMWWGGSSQNGWGMALMQQYTTLFAVWFTYDASGSASWFVMPGGTWTSDTTYEGRLYRTTSSPWAGVAYDPARLQVIDAGSFRLRFDGATPTFEYSADGRTGSLPLTRQPF
jgi:hypothetical protein